MKTDVLLPSIAISGSNAQPGKPRVFPPGFSWAVNNLPTLTTNDFVISEKRQFAPFSEAVTKDKMLTRSFFKKDNCRS